MFLSVFICFYLFPSISISFGLFWSVGPFLEVKNNALSVPDPSNKIMMMVVVDMIMVNDASRL